MKEKRKLETTKKERRKAIYLAIYATVLLLVPLLLSLIFGFDEATPSYIIAISIAAVIICVGAYTFVMFLNNYHRNNPTEEPKNPENKLLIRKRFNLNTLSHTIFKILKGIQQVLVVL